MLLIFYKSILDIRQKMEVMFEMMIELRENVLSERLLLYEVHDCAFLSSMNIHRSLHAILDYLYYSVLGIQHDFFAISI